MSDIQSKKGGAVHDIIHAYFDSLQLELRMVDSCRANTRLGLYGESFDTPIMTAALSHIDMVGLAKGAKAAGAVLWAGIGDDDTLREMIDTGAKVIKIIKPYEDEDLIYRKLEACEKYGALAVGMDIDFFFGGVRSKYTAKGTPVAPKTLDDLKRYVNATKLPFIMKGVLSEQDAVKSLEAGAGGIVVSQHGRSVMDYTIAPARILPHITKLVDGKIPVFLDGGIMRGIDVFKSLALGATAVSAGTALMGPLSAEGPDGVKRVIDEMTEELAWAMEHTGSSDLSHIDPTILWPAQRL